MPQSDPTRLEDEGGADWKDKPVEHLLRDLPREALYELAGQIHVLRRLVLLLVEVAPLEVEDGRGVVRAPHISHEVGVAYPDDNITEATLLGPGGEVLHVSFIESQIRSVVGSGLKRSEDRHEQQNEVRALGGVLPNHHERRLRHRQFPERPEQENIHAGEPASPLLDDEIPEECGRVKGVLLRQVGRELHGLVLGERLMQLDLVLAVRVALGLLGSGLGLLLIAALGLLGLFLILRGLYRPLFIRDRQFLVRVVFCGDLKLEHVAEDLERVVLA